MDGSSASKVFEQLAVDLVLEDGRHRLYSAIGIDPYDWPPSPARDAATGFLERMRAKGEASARLESAESIRFFSATNLPSDSGELRAVYDRAMTWSAGFELARKLSRSPLDVDQIVNEFRLKRSRGIGAFVLAESLSGWTDRLFKRIEEGKQRVLIPDWHKLSKMIGGFNPGRISLTTAGTGVGKTAFALSFAMKATEVFPVLFVNMEMNTDDMISRCVAAGAGISFDRIQTGEIDFERVSKFVEKLEKRLPLEITDGRSLTLEQIVAKICLAKSQRPELGMAIVDYDQKIRFHYSGRGGDQEREYQQLLQAVESLEDLAKRLDIHIMLLSQANDDGDPRASKRSKQPASTVLHFYEDQHGHFIKAIKNRFGQRDACLKVKFDGPRSLVTEEDYWTRTERGGGFRL